MSLAMAVRAAARMVAFIPEQSPPLVKIASRFMVISPDVEIFFNPENLVSFRLETPDEKLLVSILESGDFYS